MESLPFVLLCGFVRPMLVMEKSFLILGVGNILLKDEGLGVRAVEFFKRRYRIPSCVKVLDGGTAGLRLLPLFKEYDHVIIIDAVAAGNEPGALYRIPAEKLKKSPPLMATAHEIDIKDLLSLASLEGPGAKVVIIGMTPEDVSPGLELSPVIAKRIPLLADMVKKELESFGLVLHEAD